jgi:hypothetical protein
MPDDGEPISRGQLKRRAAEARALRTALFGVALFTGVVLVNGILAILFIALMQALGLWQVPASESAQGAITELSAWVERSFGAHGLTPES